MDRVLALGFFDGVHIGHGQLFKVAMRQAAKMGANACALTYDTHPQTFITGRPVPLLCSTEERAGYIRSIYSIPEVIIDPFDEETARTPWREYIDAELIGRLGAVYIIAGHDFTFGRFGEGTPEKLKAYCAEHGVGCSVIPPKRVGGIRVSSTYIRGLVAEGDMERATQFLGHRYRLSGKVQRGRGLGRKFGFPTVNLPLHPGRQQPEWGVYATLVSRDGDPRVFPAVTNVGIRPTIEAGGAPVVESTLLDFDGDLYGEHIGVEFVKFIRSERTFPSPEALTEQIWKDKGNAQDILSEISTNIPGKK